MASSITLKVATLTSAVTFAKTDQEVASVLRLFIKDWASPMPEGLTTAQQNQWALDQATARIVAMVRQEAQRARLRELREAQASIEDLATADTAI